MVSITYRSSTPRVVKVGLVGLDKYIEIAKTELSK
jgi:hypothetical protein